MAALATQTIRETKSSVNFLKVASKDQAAAKDYIETYRNFVCALAGKFTNSTEEAEAAAREIFTDICRHAERDDKTDSPENLLTSLIAQRQLIRFLQ